MSAGRITLGCRVLLVKHPGDDKVMGGYFAGLTGVTIEGPYPAQRLPGSTLAEDTRCWSVAGPEIAALCRVRWPNGDTWLMNVPESRLVRIDDPDVELDTSVGAGKPSTVGA